MKKLKVFVTPRAIPAYEEHGNVLAFHPDKANDPDRIDALLLVAEEGEQAPTVPEWASVDDGLPKEQEVVLVSGGIAHIYHGSWHTLTGVNYPGLPIQWEVKWWQPIPIAPL